MYRAPSTSSFLKISATPAYQGTLSLSQASSRWVGCRALDTDPAFQVNPDPIRIQDFDDQKLKGKKMQHKFFFLSFL